MTHKYESQCWSCGSKDMEHQSTHVKCRSCGATWNYVPQEGAVVIILERDFALGAKGKSSAKSARPSGIISRKAARARATAGDKVSPK